MSQDAEAYARIIGMLDSMIAELFDESDPEREMSGAANATDIAKLLGSSPKYAATLLKALGDVSLHFDGAGGVDGLEWAVYIALRLGERVGFANGMAVAGVSSTGEADDVDGA